MTQLDIYNGALATLGHDQEVLTLTENSAVRIWCERFYNQDRQELIREIAPQWARAYEDLGTGTAVTDNAEWAYSFQLPKNLLTLRVVKDGKGENIPFKLFGGDLYANSEKVVIEFVADVLDTTKFDVVFNRALMCKIAMDIALPLTGEPDTRNQMVRELASAMSDARNMDAQDNREVGQPADPNWWANCRGAKFNPGYGTADGRYFPGSNP